MGTSATALERPLARLPWRAPPDALHRSWALNRPLTVLGVAMGLTLAAATAGLVLDPRVITGQPAWLKPAKFAVSIAIYSFTLVWLLGFVRGHGRWVGLVSWATAVALLGEMVVLVLQVVRGTASHFNVATPLDAALWNTMGGLIVVVWLMGLLAAALLLVQRFPEPVFAWGLRLGLAVALAGMAAGLLMTSPTRRNGRPPAPGRGSPSPAPTAWACPTTAPACPWSAGAPPGATCASATSWASTACRRWRWLAGCSPGPRPRAGSPAATASPSSGWPAWATPGCWPWSSGRPCAANRSPPRTRRRCWRWRGSSSRRPSPPASVVLHGRGRGAWKTAPAAVRPRRGPGA